MNQGTHKDLEVWQFREPQDFHGWLAENFGQSESVWLRLAKKNSNEQTLSYEEARERAIIWGWIDGLVNRWDEDFYLIKFTPRRSRSKWSKINRGIAEQLIADGEMKPSGLAQVEAAKADGRWEAAYDSSKTIQVPDDFAARLAANPKAQEQFSQLSSGERFKILIQIQDAKRPDTRERRMQKFLELLIRGEKP